MAKHSLPMSYMLKVVTLVEPAGSEVTLLRAKQRVRGSIPDAGKEFGSFFLLSTPTSVHQAV